MKHIENVKFEIMQGLRKENQQLKAQLEVAREALEEAKEHFNYMRDNRSIHQINQWADNAYPKMCKVLQAINFKPNSQDANFWICDKCSCKVCNKILKCVVCGNFNPKLFSQSKP